jgi:hypothetical protein
VARAGRGFPTHPARIRVPTGPRAGTGVISLAFNLAGSGVKHASGTGVITLAFTSSTTEVKHAADVGATTLAFTLSASGVRHTGIGLPPRPRTRWQLVAGPAAGGYDLALTEATSRHYVARLTDNNELSFNLDGRLSQTAAVIDPPLGRDVHLLFTGSEGTTSVLDRMRVGQTTHTFSEDAIQVAVTGLAYKAMLQRRILYSDATLTYTGVDQAEIAWALIAYTQGKLGGDLGISKAWAGTSPTGQLRDRTYEVGDSVGQRIQELSEVIGGFDWDVTPTSASGLQLDVWWPQRGVDRGVVLEHGGLMLTATREVNPSDYANAIRYTGAQGDGTTPGPTPDEIEAPDLASMPQGRWDAALGDDGLTTQAALDDRAAWQLGQSQDVTPVWTVVLKRGAWDGPDHIWLGDWVRVIAHAEGLDVDTRYRVYEVDITLDGAGGETVQLTLGGPRPRYARRVTEFERRLRNLERR